MQYRYRYDIGPWYADRPFASKRRGSGVLNSVLHVVWLVVAFVLQLVVWAVLLVVGIVYTLVWLILWPFERLSGRRR